ncbi:MAG TPA: hypothetical protein VIW92_01860 [Thermoanaerobaculia bacterium]
MKKTPKKLTLSRETLVHLEESLRQVEGGATYTCEWSGYRTCGTCQRTCGTNLC